MTYEVTIGKTLNYTHFELKGDHQLDDMISDMLAFITRKQAEYEASL